MQFHISGRLRHPASMEKRGPVRSGYALHLPRHKRTAIEQVNVPVNGSNGAVGQDEQVGAVVGWEE